MLGSLGGVEGLVVADLCCGSGALGIEALSRGASSVVFVDESQASLAATRENLTATGLAYHLDSGAARLVRSGLLAYLDRCDAFDLALCDPPYAFSTWAVVLGRIPSDLAVCESDVPIAPAGGFFLVRERRHGGTLVTVFARHDPSGHVPAEGTEG